MAYVVTDDQNYSDIADAIRAKGVSGTFRPNEMPASIGQILTAKYNETGRIYTEHVVVPDAVTSLGSSIYAINGIRSINLNNVTSFANYACGSNNTGLASLICPKLTSYGAYLCLNGEALKTIQLGSIGYPVTSISFNKWLGNVSGRGSGGFTITIYVDAARIDDVPENVVANAKGGSGAYCNAVIYRNSITGEVLEG